MKKQKGVTAMLTVYFLFYFISKWMLYEFPGTGQDTRLSKSIHPNRTKYGRERGLVCSGISHYRWRQREDLYFCIRLFGGNRLLLLSPVAGARPVNINRNKQRTV